jgi:copper chaperone CopZ
METMKFKTNIKCGNCLAKVTPFLDAAVGEKNWEVDINNPSKILTVAGEANEAKVRESVEKAGYKAEKVLS